MILFQLEEWSVGDDRVGHDLFDHHGIGTDERCETVDRSCEEIIFVECHSIEDEVGAGGEERVGNGDDKIEFQEFFRAPQRFDHLRVEKNNDHIDDGMPDVQFNETVRDKGPRNTQRKRRSFDERCSLTNKPDPEVRRHDPARNDSEDLHTLRTEGETIANDAEETDEFRRQAGRENGRLQFSAYIVSSGLFHDLGRREKRTKAILPDNSSKALLIPIINGQIDLLCIIALTIGSK